MKYYATVGESTYELEIKEDSDGKVMVTVDNKVYSVDFRMNSSSSPDSFIIDGKHYEAFCSRNERNGYQVDILGTSYQVLLRRTTFNLRGKAGFSGNVKRESIVAPMPGLLVALKVNPGDMVLPGQPLLILEAMKMQNEVRSPTRAKVADIFVSSGSTVERNEHLLDLELL